MNFFDYATPFFYIGPFGIKLSLVFLILYGLLVLLLNRFSKEHQCNQAEKPQKKAWPDAIKAWMQEHIKQIGIAAVVFCPAVFVYFAGPDSALGSAFSSIMKWETPLAGLLFIVAICGVFQFSKNRGRFLRTVNTVVKVFLALSVYATLATHQIKLSEYCNWLCVLILGIVFIVMCTFEYKPADLPKSSNRFAPVTESNLLFPELKLQATRLADMIMNDSFSMQSICVSGKWGSGKTSVVNGAMELVSKDKPGDYEEIRIDAMQMDSTQTLLSYVFGEIKRCLQKRGAYVGLGSEYRDVLSSLLKAGGASYAGVWLEKVLFPSSENYRKQKEQMKALVSSTMDAGKIVIVLDDIERCDPEKAKEFIYFTKEIAEMVRCVIIFVADYEYLEKAIHQPDYSDTDEADDPLFYQKFFNHRIDLPQIDLSEAMSQMDEQLTRLRPGLEYEAFLLPSERYAQWESETESKKKQDVPKANEQAKEVDWEGFIKRLSLLLSNPRQLISVYHYMGSAYSFINQEMQTDSAQLKKAFSIIRLDELFLMYAILHVCFPGKKKRIFSKGISKYYESHGMEGANFDADDDFLFLLFEDRLFQRSVFDHGIHTTYQQEKAIRFLEQFQVDRQAALQNLDTFEKEEDEIFSSIDTGKIPEGIDAWRLMVKTVTGEYYGDDHGKIQKARERLSTLLSAAANNVKAKEWNADDVLVVITDLINDRQVVRGLYIMDLVAQKLGDPTFIGCLSSSKISRFDGATYRYAFTSVEPLYQQLFYFLSPPQMGREGETKLLSTAHERLLQSDSAKDMVLRLNQFLTTVHDLLEVPGFELSDDIIKTMENLNDAMSNTLLKNNIPDDEVKLAAEEIQAMINDIKSYIAFSEQLHETVSDISGEQFSENDDVIRHFETELLKENTKVDPKFRKEFTSFFDQIWHGYVQLSDGEIERLSSLITRYCALTSERPIFYRKRLMDYQYMQGQNRSTDHPEDLDLPEMDSQKE